MTQEEFIQKTMIALMSNPKVTNADNFDDSSHHTDVYLAALKLSRSRADGIGEDVLCFDDYNSDTADRFPLAVSERECLHEIGIALQAIANKKSIREQQLKNNGNLESSEIVWP